MVEGKEAEKLEYLVGFERWQRMFSYSAGPIRGRFLVELRDDKRITGVKCPECGRTYVPPRPTCLRCFRKMDEFVEVSNIGTIISYTVLSQSESYHPSKKYFPIEPLLAYGIIQLDGADTGLVHFLGEVDPQKISIGMRVQAVFREKREGSILDIKYFKPLVS